MITVGLNEMKLQYQHLQEMVPTSVNPESTPYYVFLTPFLYAIQNLHLSGKCVNVRYSGVLAKGKRPL